MVLQTLKDEDLKEVKWYVDRRLAKSAEAAQSTVEEYVPYSTLQQR
jgi:hypothetical protein